MSEGKQTMPGLDGENDPRGAFTAVHQAAQAKVRAGDRRSRCRRSASALKVRLEVLGSRLGWAGDDEMGVEDEEALIDVRNVSLTLALCHSM